MVEEMSEMDNVIMENVAQLSENMSKMASTIADAIASIRAVLIPQAPFYPSIPPFNACSSQSTCLSWFTVKYANIRASAQSE